MITLGHHKPWEYGFTFFNEVLKEQEKTRLRNMQDLAIAVRFSRSSKKAFMSFISEAAGGNKPKGISGYQYFKMRKGNRGNKKRKS